MVEVFKTNVQQKVQAKLLVDQIHRSFAGYDANFDLEDCDRVLRIKSSAPEIRALCIIRLLQDFGFAAEILDDVAAIDTHNAFGIINYQ